MKRVAPSEATNSALRAACGEVVSVALVPEGYWHEFLPRLNGYDPGAMRLEMKGGGALELWSEYVRPIADSTCEPFVVAARYRAAADAPWKGAAVAVELSWQESPPLSHLLGARSISNFEELAVENVWTDEEVILASDGIRMNLSGAVLEVFVNWRPAAFLVSSPSMPQYRSAPTGEIQWLSRTYKRTKGACRDV